MKTKDRIIVSAVIISQDNKMLLGKVQYVLCGSDPVRQRLAGG